MPEMPGNAGFGTIDFDDSFFRMSLGRTLMDSREVLETAITHKGGSDVRTGHLEPSGVRGVGAWLFWVRWMNG
jgi:hypothetical protein